MSELSDVAARITNLETARKIAPAVRRLDRAAEEFRITPAQREMYGKHALQLAEGGADWLLSEIELRPPIAALAKTLDESARLDQAAKAHMSEQGTAGNKISYKAALLHVSVPGKSSTANYSPVASSSHLSAGAPPALE